MWKFVCYILFCVGITACNSVKEDRSASMMIDWDNMEYGDLVLDEIEYIPLETVDLSLLGRIDKILYRKNQFYVLDKKTAGVYVFDKAGRFLSSIQKKGEAPDEYIELMDMDVDDEGNVYVADNARMNILRYESPGWELKEKYYVGNHFYEFACLDNRAFVLKDVFDANGLKCKLAYYDSHNKSQMTILENTLSGVNELDILKCAKYGLYRSGTDLFYNERFTPYVYSISNNGKLSCEYTVASDKYASETDLKPLEGNPMKFLQERSLVKDIVSLYATDDYFVCMPFIAPSATVLFVPKQCPSQSKKIDLSKISSIVGSSGVEGVVENKLLFVLNQLDDDIKSKNINLREVNEDSNPVLVLCGVKSVNG